MEMIVSSPVRVELHQNEGAASKVTPEGWWIIAPGGAQRNPGNAAIIGLRPIGALRNDLCSSRAGKKLWDSQRFLPAIKASHLVSASAAFAARIQSLVTLTVYSFSNQRKPKSSMHSGKSGLITI